MVNPPPIIVNITANPAVINDYKVGPNTLLLTATFSESMDQTVVPMVSFPDCDKEAIEVYREWLAKPDRVQY